MIPKLSNISYEMRLKECGLTTLETRRLRDQIEVFKILNRYEKVHSACVHWQYMPVTGAVYHFYVFSIHFNLLFTI